VDTLTHALSGALAARACAGRSATPALVWAGFAAAAFPDVDFALRWLAPEQFLNWHRGPTHSLVLAPLGAALLAVVASRLAPRPGGWRYYYGVCLLGLSVHAAGDVITLYGTQLLWPLSSTPFAWRLVFDIDPWLSLIVILGFLLSLRGNPRRAAAWCVVAIASYLILQSALRAQIQNLGDQRAVALGEPDAFVVAIPQPYGPATWKLVVVSQRTFDVSYVAPLIGVEIAPTSAWWPLRQLAPYRPPDRLEWREWPRIDFLDDPLIAAAWGAQPMAPFRRFAVLPTLYRIERSDAGACVWFTDLRHALPAQPPPFRYGVCRDTVASDWQGVRLPFFSDLIREVFN
jgi:inner membrane protein